MSRGQGGGLGRDWGQRNLWLLFMRVWPEGRARPFPVAAGILPSGASSLGRAAEPPG